MLSDVNIEFADKIASIVNEGMDRLDLVSKSWRDRINTEQLNMVKVNDCLLTQAFGGYKVGLDYLGIELGEEYGFDIPDTIYDADVQEEVYEMLTNEWIGCIESITEG